MKLSLKVVALAGAAAILASCTSIGEVPAENQVISPQAESVSATASDETEPWPYEDGELMSGTATPDFPEGEPGEVSVVQVGPFDGSSLLFAYRNNTDVGISHIDWSATARSGGKIVATGSSQGGTPAQVPPGGVGLAYIYFGSDTNLPTDAEYEFSENHMPADTSPYNSAPFVITETNNVGGSIVGAAVNRTGSRITGPYSVNVYCFDGNDLTSSARSFTEQSGDLEDGGTVSFTADLHGEQCPTYLVGVSGWFNPS